MRNEQSSMRPGDLVELCIEYGLHAGSLVCVADEFGPASSNRYIAVGTLAVYLGEKRHGAETAAVILIDGQPGWVWPGEISPAAGATVSGP